MRDSFNNQFSTQKLRTEISATSAGPGSATFTSGTGEQTAPRATKKVVRKKIKEDQKDVEPKLAAGEAENYVKDHWGWKEAPSVPNRPSKGGFQYKQLFENMTMSDLELDYPEFIPVIEKVADYLGTDIQEFQSAQYKVGDEYIEIFMPQSEKTVMIDVLLGGKLRINTSGPVSSMQAIIEDFNKKATVFKKGDRFKIGKYEYEIEKRFDNGDYKLKNTEEGYPGTTAPEDTLKRAEKLNENYSRFKKETRTRTNEQQLHTAMRLAEKKIHEANRILEYTSKLRTELTETRVNKNTQKLMERITRGIAEAYGKMKKLK